MTMPETLKPDELAACPFCGGTNVMPSGSMSRTQVWCKSCSAVGPSVWHGGPTDDRATLNRCEAEAVTLWNRRAPTTAEAALVKARTALEYAHKGLDMVHNGLMDPTRPRQAVGEVCFHFLGKTSEALKAGEDNG